ncbi:hypothetical protein LEP1GSC133_2632 [Leptospira borgpetersenii serovar Pomona str. 200901868]|uniref:Uncharacterized protein n=1 Tax=Leptospira borgpetersenii serovar Pomona str. 200901868 TaxID=1192866 RepID=M6VUA6_LEPBO|nr:hypothetical protein LEP1GSC133_2632 [Leptospira borgpetersenii serovar Pomona str. 200901868]
MLAVFSSKPSWTKPRIAISLFLERAASSGVSEKEERAIEGSFEVPDKKSSSFLRFCFTSKKIFSEVLPFTFGIFSSSLASPD